MQIFEIQEPKSSLPKTIELAIGIDFGTTNSLVAYSINHNAYVIDDELVPSLISDNLDIGAGHLRSIKRLIGKTYEEIIFGQEISEIVKKSIKKDNDTVKLRIGEQYFSLPEAIALILKFLKDKAEKHLGKPVNKAVITVPAHFDDAERSIIKHAGTIAGLEILRLISEPTAAAYSYGLENSSEGLYAVYDLGGGTFDLSLLKMQMGVFQVLATDGDINLGGDDIDHLLFEYFKQIDSHAEFAATPSAGYAMGSISGSYEMLNQVQHDMRLRLIAKEAKEHLTHHDIYHNKDLGITLDQNKFETLITPIIDRTIKITRSVISKILPELKGIILVGGSSRIPLIRKKLEVFSTTIYDNVDPDKVVALGAALQAENLISGSKNLIIDVVPLSLGMELMGGIAEKIIMRNTPLPASIKKEFATYADNQTAMAFNIIQGEREFAKDCRSITKFEVTVPAMKAGAAKVEVIFNVDADGLLSIETFEKISNNKTIIEVRPTYGITEKDVITMLEDAYKNAEEDHSLRLLIITKIEAEQEIKNTEAALKETPELLSAEEIKNIESTISILQKDLKTDDRDKIHKSLENLRTQIKDFAFMRMDFAVQKVLRGKNVE